VHNTDLLLVDGTGILESEAEDALGGLLGDKLDALDDAIDNDVLNAGVFTLGVLTDQDGVDIIVGGLVASDGAAGTDVGEEVEGTTESEVQRNMSLSDGGGEGTLQGDIVASDALNGIVGNGGLSVLQNGSDIDGLPLDGRLYEA
jgi:hypothetical protein